jgi:hypothetical protein
MKTSREIAEELFGEASAEGWHARIGHAVSADKFDQMVRALDQVRDDGRELQRRDEAQMRRRLAELLRAITGERDALLATVNRAKTSFDNLEGRFAAHVVSMLRVLDDEVQTAPAARHQ